MSITIELEPGQEAQLRKRAARQGQDPARYAAEILQQALNEHPRKNAGDNALDRAVAAMTSRTPEQMAQARERALQAGPPPRPLPPDKTLADAIMGKWPGDETDEQIQVALGELS